MAARPVMASPEMNAEDAAGLMAANDIGVVPVTEEDRLVGLVTDRDLVLRVIAERKEPRSVRLGDVATTRGIETVSPDMQLCDARALMAERGIRRLPVVKDSHLVGMLSLGDVALGSASMRGVGETLAAISASVSTEEVDPGPDVGTPERVKAHREASSQPSADVGREPVAGPLRPAPASHSPGFFPEFLQGLRDESGHVHLRDPELIGDLGLGPAFEEPQVQDPTLPLRQVTERWRDAEPFL